MHILFYSSSSTLYGAPSSLLNLIEGLCKSNPEIRISVILPEKGLIAKEFLKLPVDVYFVPVPKWVYNRKTFVRKSHKSKLIGFLWLLKQVVEKVLANTYWLPKHVIQIKKIKPDIVYVNSTICATGVFAGKICKTTIVWHHRETLNEAIVGLYSILPHYLQKKIINLANWHVYPSKFLLDSYKPYLEPGANNNSIIYNGVYFKNNLDYKRKINSSPRIGIVGRINSQKGQMEILELLKQNQQIDIILKIFGIGTPDEIRLLEKFQDQIKMELMGFQPREMIFSEIDFLLVNAQNESFGRVIAEAFYFGIPVIARASGAIPELIHQNKTGFLYKNMAELSSILSSLTKIDYLNFSRNCQEAFNMNFSIENYSGAIYKMLLELE